VLMGDGERLFDNLGNHGLKLEIVRVLDAPNATHVRYRVS
jgi:hypothetical protein